MRFSLVSSLVLLQLVPGYAATIFISPATQNVLPGQTITVSVRVDAVTDLFAFGFDLGFNPSVLSATSITEGPFLATAGTTLFIPGSIDNASGTVSATGDTLLTAIQGASGSGVLAQVSFTVVGAGNSALNIFGATLLDSSLSGIPVTTQSGSVTAAATPEPATWLLLGTVLLFFGWRRDRL